MKKLFTIYIVLICLNLSNAYCQTDKPVSVESEEYLSLHGYKVPEKPIFYKFGYALTKNEMHVLEKLTLNERRFIEKAVDPPAIGVVRDLKEPINFTLSIIDIPAQGEIQTSGGRLSRINQDTLVFTTYVRSENADEIRLFFSEAYLPLGTQVNLFSKDGYAFTQSDLTGNLDENGFYTTTTFADYVIIQVVIPVNIIKENLHFVISKVTHVDNIYNVLNKPAAECYEDANCNNANGFTYIDNLRKATAQLSWPTGNLMYSCTGGLLNDRRSQDFQPFLLTANHCFSTQSVATGLEARFDFRSTSCNSGGVNQNTIVVIGANLIKTNTQTDFTLVLLKEQPGGSRTYLGWSTNSIVNNALLNSVHHPNGTFQKWSLHQNKTSPAYSCFSTTYFHYTKTLAGQTFPGSSGGLIVNASGQVVGQLYGWCGTEDYCNYNNYYNMWGRFNASYSNNNLQYWLNNGGASVRMAISPVSTLNYGDVGVGSYEDHTVTVTNSGTRPNYLNLEAGNATISGANANQFSIVGSNFLYLSPGRSGTFKVRFSPTNTGSKTATLNIPNNADNISGTKRITLTGCALPSQPDYITGFRLPSKYVQYTYSIPAVPGATLYTWNYSGAGTLIGNGTSCTLSATSNGILSVTANISCGSGLPRILELTVVEGIRLYPNPVLNELVIEFGGNREKVTFEIFNAIGQIVFKSNLIEKTIVQTSSFSRGVYFIRFQTGKTFELKKVVKE